MNAKMKPSGDSPQLTTVSVIFCGQYRFAARNWNTPTLPTRNRITAVRFNDAARRPARAA